MSRVPEVITLLLGLYFAALTAILRLELRLRRGEETGRTRVEFSLSTVGGLVRIRRSLAVEEQELGRRLLRWAVADGGEALGGLRRRFWPPPPSARYLLRRARFRRFEMRAALGLGNPAWTALGFGGAWGGVGAALAMLYRLPQFRRCRPRIVLLPDFRREGLRLALHCIVDISAAHAMCTGLLFVRERLTLPEGGKAKWPNIQSKV